MIIVNGQGQTHDMGLTLAGLIERLGLGGKAVAAEVNKQIVPRRDHARHELRDGDVVELVSLVGGG